MKRFVAVLVLLAGCTTQVPVNARCETSADCADGLICVGNKCDACTSDAQCAAGARCGVVGPGRCGCLDQDGDGVACGDCDDADALRFPGATEVCDGRDNDCDGETDEGVVPTWYADQDGDGFGETMLSISRCQAPNGFAARGGDCNDADPTAFPQRTEVCDGRDNNCDGAIDEGVRATWYRDADGDGYGDANNTVTTCLAPTSGFVAVSGDCDDSRADANPHAQESCNALDDDCDGVADDFTRACSNACGSGTDRCTSGLWQGCDAPVITTIQSTTATLSGGAAVYECLLISANSFVTVPADVTVTASGWIRVNVNGQLVLGPRAKLQAAREIAFTEQSVLRATDATLQSGTSVTVGQDVRWLVQATDAPAYSGGGSPSCGSGTIAGVGGAAGGSRGGSGGRGGSCPPLVTQPQNGAGGMSAVNGANGCDCPCNMPAPGAFSAGGGGAILAGGGGGANGGAGGAGAPGYDGTAFTTGGTAGLAETGALFGGGGGGSSGANLVSYAPEACQGAGGAGGGIVRVIADTFTNRGLLLADGAVGRTPGGGQSHQGGGGGGAGGTWSFTVRTFENLASISAVGGNGGNGVGGGITTRAGGGGGGGGGRVIVTGPGATAPNVLARGNLYVGGGTGGTGLAGNGGPGTLGVVDVP